MVAKERFIGKKAILQLMVLFLFMAGPILPLENGISGTVTDGKTGLPLARVRVKGTPHSTTADFNGRFILKEIPSLDSLIVTAWAEGFYNGEIHAAQGDTGIIVTLHPLVLEDNSNYQWISPELDASEELRCGNCHAAVLMDQWRNNAHGKAATNPFFLAMYYGTDIHGDPEKGVGYKRDFDETQGNCATCHIPGAAVSKPWGVDPKGVSGVSLHGVFCDFCHKIYQVKPSTGQGTTGVLSIGLLRPFGDNQVFFGPFDDIHEPDAYLPLIRRSEFCAPCHTGKFWGIPAYSSFPEWQASPYPEMGIECQTCHMAPDGITTNFAPGKGGLERDPLTIPSHLQPGSRDPDILANSVTMQVTAQQSGDSIEVRATIYNDQTGHHVPTGRPSRNMILLVEAKTRVSSLQYLGNEKVPDWGGIGDPADGNYAGLPGKGYAKILEDFEELSPAPSWRPTRILSDNRIAAFEADTSYFYFEAPGDSTEILISGKLLYRRFFKATMDEKLFNIPDIEMEHEEIKLEVVPVAAGSPLSGDFDDNGEVDFDDFFLFADVFGGTDSLFDLNDSGGVDFDDFFILADNFGRKAEKEE